jgi:hypothetical protein
MINLTRFFVNPFNDEEISQAKIETFTIHHIAAMVASNGNGALSTLITQTTNLSSTFAATMSDKLVLLGVQKARVQAKEIFRANLADELSKLYGAVTAKYGKKGSKTAEIFPGGLSLYGDCADSQLGPNLAALHDAMNANIADLSSTPVNRASELKTQWASIFSEASTGKAQHDSGIMTVRNAAKALRAQLGRNLHECAILFPEDEAKAALLFPQQYLENHPQTPGEPDPQPTPTP